MNSLLEELYATHFFALPWSTPWDKISQKLWRTQLYFNSSSISTQTQPNLNLNQKSISTSTKLQPQLNLVSNSASTQPQPSTQYGCDIKATKSCFHFQTKTFHKKKSFANQIK